MEIEMKKEMKMKMEMEMFAVLTGELDGEAAYPQRVEAPPEGAQPCSTH
jgi:hypothetical protein